MKKKVVAGLAMRTFAGALGLAGLLAPMGDAMAVSYHPWVRQSHVASSVTDNGSGSWGYAFTLYNDSFEDNVLGVSGPMPVIVDWELPWFPDAGIADILTPNGWNWAIETVGMPNLATGWDGIAAWQNASDPLYQGATSPFTTVTKVLHWYSECWVNQNGCTDELDNAIFPVEYSLGQTSLGGFGFAAGYDDTAAPYQASWANLPVWTGDPSFPLGLPASPLTKGPTTVPEPSTLFLLAGGLMGLIAFRKRLTGREV